MKLFSLISSVGLGLLLAPISLADEAMELAQSRCADYVAAFEAADAAKVAALFAPDVRYTIDGTETVTGREAIVARSKAFFDSVKDPKVSLVVESARFLTPDVLIEEGTAEVSFADSPAPELSRYSATHVKKEGKWQIAELQEFAAGGTDAAGDALAELDWMIGTWKLESGDDKLEASATRTLDGHFITRTVRINREDGNTFTTVEVIGFDPSQGVLRSWLFDNEGGFGEATYRREGNKWMALTKATLPGGGEASSQHIFTVVDADHVDAEAVNRVLDGEVLPNRDRVRIVRSATSAPTKSPAK